MMDFVTPFILFWMSLFLSIASITVAGRFEREGYWHHVLSGISAALLLFSCILYIVVMRALGNGALTMGWVSA
jgi:uncharacterized membrane protein